MLWWMEKAWHYLGSAKYCKCHTYLGLDQVVQVPFVQQTLTFGWLGTRKWILIVVPV